MESKLFVSYEVPFSYTLSLYNFSGHVMCMIFYQLTNSFSTIKTSISIPELKYLKLIPTSFLRNVILLSPDHSKVFLSQGLRGGGCCSARRLPLSLEKTYKDLKYLNLQSLDERKSFCSDAIELSRVISLTMKDSTFDRQKVKKLFEYKPCDMSDPIFVVSRLLQNIENYLIWNGVTYIDERGQLIQMLRKLMVNGILACHLETSIVDYNGSFIGVSEKLEKIEKFILKNESKFPESLTLICVQSMMSYVKNSIFLISVWDKSVMLLEELAYSLLHNSSRKPKEVFLKILAGADQVLPHLSTHFFYYFLIFDALEYRLQKFENFDTGPLRLFLEKEVQKNKSWEFKIILIEYIMKFVYSGAFENAFCLYLLDIIENFSTSQEWRVRERCAYVLRIASGMDNSEIREKSFELHEKMKEKVGEDERVKIILALPLFQQGKSKARLNTKFLNNIKNYYDTFLRESEVKNLDQRLKDSKIVVLSGLTGMGKTRVAVEYVNKYKHFYDYIAFFNCENEDKFNLSLSECALNLTENSSQVNLVDQVTKIFKRPDLKILVIFDDCLDVKTIRNFLFPDVYKIITSKKNQWEESKMQVISRLTTDDSISLIKLNIFSSISENNYRKLARILNGWPLAIKIMSGEIKHDKQIQDDYIKKIPEEIITKKKIKEKLKNLFTNLDEDTQVLLGFIWFCEPGEIPVNMLQKAYEGYIKKDSWWKAVGEIENFYIGEYNDDVIDVHNKVFQGFEGFAKQEYAESLLGFINGSILYSEKTDQLENKGLVCRHGLRIIEKYKQESEDKIEVCLKICSFYIREKFDSERVKLMCNEAKNMIGRLTVNPGKETRLSELLICLGSNFFHLKDLEKSKECFEQSFKLGDDSSIIDERLKILRGKNLVKVMSHSGISDNEAIVFYKRYLNLLKKKRNNEIDLTSVYKKIAELYFNTKKFTKSMKYYKIVLASNGNNSKIDYSAAADINLKLAKALLEKEKYENAIEFCNDAISAQQKIEKPTSEPFMLLGKIFENQSVFGNKKDYLEESQHFYKEALELETRWSKNHIDLLLKLAEINEKLESYEDAIKYYNSYLAEKMKTRVRGFNTYSDIYKKISSCFEKTCDYTSAISFYIKSMQMDEVNNENSDYIIKEYLELSNLYKKVNDFQNAQLYSEKILDIYKGLHGEKSAQVANSYFDLGLIYFESKQLDEAYQKFKLCKNIKAKLRDLNETELLGPLFYLSEIAIMNENYNKGIKILLVYKGIQEKYTQKTDQKMLETYLKISELYKKINNLNKATEYFEEYKKCCGQNDEVKLTDFGENVEELKKNNEARVIDINENVGELKKINEAKVIDLDDSVEGLKKTLQLG